MNISRYIYIYIYMYVYLDTSINMEYMYIYIYIYIYILLIYMGSPHDVMSKVFDSGFEVSSNFSKTVTFTFGLIPLGMV